MFHKVQKILCFHPYYWICITMTTYTRTIQNMGTKMHPLENENGGTVFPVAEMAITEAPNVPLSADSCPSA
jgi:hypothetical protein